MTALSIFPGSPFADCDILESVGDGLNDVLNKNEISGQVRRCVSGAKARRSRNIPSLTKERPAPEM